MKNLILLCVLVLPSCGFLQEHGPRLVRDVADLATAVNGLRAGTKTIGDVVAGVSKGYEDVRHSFTAFASEWEKQKALADANKDGETDWSEWWQYGLLALGIGGGTTAEAMRRSTKSRNAASDERKSRAEERIAKLEASLPTLV